MGEGEGGQEIRGRIKNKNFNALMMENEPSAGNHYL